MKTSNVATSLLKALHEVGYSLTLVDGRLRCLPAPSEAFRDAIRRNHDEIFAALSEPEKALSQKEVASGTENKLALCSDVPQKKEAQNSPQKEGLIVQAKKEAPPIVPTPEACNRIMDLIGKLPPGSTEYAKLTALWDIAVWDDSRFGELVVMADAILHARADREALVTVAGVSS
ncbi:MAG: hypothetical protein WA705_14075 [Candidatus Ozemobacteraceae bacterium]